MSAPSEWDAHAWLAWLRREPSAPIPSRAGLNDCADALQAEIERLRAELAQKVTA